MFVKMSESINHKVNVVPQTWTGIDEIVRPTAEDVAALFEDALAFTAKRGEMDADTIVARMDAGDLWVNSTFRYALAKAIGKTLSGNPRFQNLYIYGSVNNDQARLTSDINLLLHVSDDRVDFENWIELLDEELVKVFRSTFNVTDGFLSLLSCHVVTDEEVTRRAGYGAMLTSVHSNIVKL